MSLSASTIFLSRRRISAARSRMSFHLIEFPPRRSVNAAHLTTAGSVSGRETGPSGARPIAPTPVLPREAQDELFGLLRSRRPSPALASPPARPAGDEVTMPSQEGLGAHHEGAPSLPRDETTQGCEQQPCLQAESRSARWAFEDVELVAQDDDLEILCVS